MTTKKNKTDWRIVCTGIACLTGLEIAAIYNGINGIAFTTVVGIIALAIGVVIKNPFTIK